MSNGHIHVGDVGVRLRSTFRKPDESAFDISLATTKEISLQKPDGTIITRAGSFQTDGVDGVLLYSTAAGDITAAGYWYLQGHVVFASGVDLHSDRVRFRVLPNSPAP